MVSSETVLRAAVRPECKERVVKAVCVNADRKLQVRDVPTPSDPPPGHLIVEVNSCAINHGDKSFLANPNAAGAVLKERRYQIWGASAAGVVRAIGADLSADLLGRKVAMYRSLNPSEYTVGLWSEQALVTRTSCVVLPGNVAARDYCGSLVNAITAHAFLEEINADGHQGVLITAGNSATGIAMGALARARRTKAIFLARSAESAAKLRELGFENVLVTADAAFEREVSELSEKLGATAVFDGVGGEITSRLAPQLPMNSAICFYGFLGAATPVTISSRLFMAKNLVLKRFSNFASATVTDPQRLAAAITYLEGVIADPLFRTRVGEEFPFEKIDEAMAFETTPGAKADGSRRGGGLGCMVSEAFFSPLAQRDSSGRCSR
jgi:NADPH:quinone reductase